MTMQEYRSYKIKIVYSGRKTVGITVKEGEIILRSPKGVGKEELFSILKKHKPWLDRAIRRDTERTRQGELISSLDERKLRRDAYEYLSAKCAEYAKIMGVTYNRISINGAKGRFGSCSAKGNINFSYRLMLYPERAREYVAVHELCHLTVMNHSKEFYSLVERYLPDYKERRRLLKSK